MNNNKSYYQEQIKKATLLKDPLETYFGDHHAKGGIDCEPGLGVALFIQLGNKSKPCHDLTRNNNKKQ
jgi:hypothetical protein